MYKHVNVSSLETFTAVNIRKIIVTGYQTVAIAVQTFVKCFGLNCAAPAVISQTVSLTN